MPKHEISEDELTKERTPRELLDWVESTIRRIGSTDEGKRALRFRKGLAKELMEDDALHFQESAEIAELDAMVQEKLMNLTLSFSTIYLVGGTKKTFREYANCPTNSGNPTKR